MPLSHWLLACAACLCVLSLGEGIPFPQVPRTSVKASSSAAIPGFVTYDDVKGSPYEVTYDTRAIKINGEPTVLLSGSIHYPRSTPAIWKTILQEAKADGLNTIQTYVFWNLHQPKENDWYFEGNANMTLFLDMAADAGLFVNLRIGPYVCAEWSYGGYPVWLGRDPALEFRRYNQPWMTQMEKFVTAIAKMAEPYLARRGGPIILAQIENEYHEDNPAGRAYIDWCGKLTTKLALDIPWVMCNGLSANETINSCNGNDCTSFLESHGQSGRILVDQPAMWTENEGWFNIWGQQYNSTSGAWESLPYSPGSRTTTNLGYTIARFFARGGSYHNYYMYYGGNHFGLVAGSSVTTAYAPAVNYHADGTANEPKRTRMNKLHAVLAANAHFLMASPAQLGAGKTYGPNVTMFAYSADSVNGVVFIENANSQPALVTIDGQSISLAGESVQIREYANSAVGTVLFDTSVVSDLPENVRPTRKERVLSQSLEWEAYSEPIALSSGSLGIIFNDRPFNQVNVTSETTEYMTYQATLSDSLSSSQPVPLTFEFGCANAVAVFVDGSLVADLVNTSHTLCSTNETVMLNLSEGVSHTLTLVSVSLGIDNLIAGADRPLKGLVGSVSVGGTDITSSGWTMRPGLQGELLKLPTGGGSSGSGVTWSKDVSKFANSQLTWYKSTFESPYLASLARKAVTSGASIVDAVTVNVGSLSRGRMYINGHDIGRFFRFPKNSPTQTSLFIPPDWLRVSGANDVVLVDELGGIDISQVTFAVTSAENVSSRKVHARIKIEE